MSLRFENAFLISGRSTDSLPIKAIGPAIAYYTQVMGFTLVSQSEKTATLVRDDARIGLAINGDDPEQASVYFAVSDVDAARKELADKGVEPTALRFDTYDGKNYRVFFAKEPYGVCFCFGQPE